MKLSLRMLMACLALTLVTTACVWSAPMAIRIAEETAASESLAQSQTQGSNLTLVPMSAFKKGVSYASWWHGEYSSPESDKILSQFIKPLGINWLAIIVTCYQKNITATKIQCKTKSRTPSDTDVIHVIQDAHRLGFRVMLKPHLDLADDSKHWRGEIGFGSNEAAWKAWFESYTKFITHYATLAQNTNADYFVVGTELVKTTRRADEWRSIINAVRKTYGGSITYGAHHFDEEFRISWWDALDAIGIDAYYPLARNDHPTIAQLKKSWNPIVSRLGKFSKKWGRPVIVTEIGYESLEGASRTPWHAKGYTINFEEQANSYQALFDAFSGHEWWHGVFWWVWRINATQNDVINGDFTIHNKPAEEVIRKYYGKQLPN